MLAHQNADEIFEYYSGINLSLAMRFLSELYKEIDTVAKNPELFQLKYKNTKVRYLRKFPYGIYYRIVDEELIEILSVIHTNRNPKIWTKRNR
ncbi:type II toxin-antitoxin system RelE/ParE family toxin [Aequorivita marisscotiae]|uniref:type II toxin-antitoxin system RelE/ParE family toxin n=1 Tax=Aequorivita marisscotiae TaxID=3040348 RepID=UPI003D6D133B